MIVVNILLVLNVSAYYSTIAEGTILILAVLAGSLSHSSTLARQLRIIGTRLSARRAGTLVSQRAQGDTRLTLTARTDQLAAGERPSFFSRNAEMLRYALPAYLCFVLVVAVTQLWLGGAVLNSATGTRSSCSRAFSPSWRSARAL